MAIKLIANYSKRLGLPGYSSHQFSVSVEAEVMNIDDVPGECECLYELLQTNVDGQIVKTGFVPSSTYGMDETPITNAANGNNGANGNHANNVNSNGNSTHGNLGDERWKCSDKQRGFILSLVEELDLDKNEVEALAVERFGHGVRLLDKMEASGLIDELQERRAPQNGNGNTNGKRRTAYANRNGGRK